MKFHCHEKFLQSFCKVSAKISAQGKTTHTQSTTNRRIKRKKKTKNKPNQPTTKTKPKIVRKDLAIHAIFTVNSNAVLQFLLVQVLAFYYTGSGTSAVFSVSQRQFFFKC